MLLLLLMSPNIIYFAVCLSVIPFPLSMCDGHQKTLYILVLVSLLLLSLCPSVTTHWLSLLIMLLVPLRPFSISLSIIAAIINNHNLCIQNLFVSSLHRKHLGAQPMELMTLLRRSNPPNTTTDSCSRGHNHPC